MAHTISTPLNAWEIAALEMSLRMAVEAGAVSGSAGGLALLAKLERNQTGSLARVAKLPKVGEWLDLHPATRDQFVILWRRGDTAVKVRAVGRKFVHVTTSAGVNLRLEHDAYLLRGEG